MRLLGAFLVLTAGFLSGRYFTEPAVHHLKLLEEGELLFRILESEIRNEKKPLPELFLDISTRVDSEWHVFFLELAKSLQQSADCTFADQYSQLFSLYMSQMFTEEEQMLFLHSGQNLLSADLFFQKKNMEQLSEQLKTHIAKSKESLHNQKKVYQALCLSMSALIVIILI